MKKAVIFVALLAPLVSVVAIAKEKAPQKVVEFAAATLVPYGADPVILKAVREENAKNKTLAQIKEEDRNWVAFKGVNDFMKSLIFSECGRHLQEITKKHPQIVEIFVMDNQGANVCMTNKTSDYWQGDEDKFVKSFNEGQGATHISDVEYDQSSHEENCQVSVPVRDGGKVVGAITFGINPRRMK